MPKVLAGFRHVLKDEGFAQKSLVRMLGSCGFPFVYSMTGNLGVMALAFKQKPNEVARSLCGPPTPEAAATP